MDAPIGHASDSGHAVPAPAWTPGIAAAVAALADDPHHPTGLPAPFYTDDAMLAFERDTVLATGWTALAFGADVPEAGDLFPVDLAGLPLLLVRGRDGALRVFHNVCRHRGMKLVAEPGNAGRVIKCPYHAWCYGLDGQPERHAPCRRPRRQRMRGLRRRGFRPHAGAQRRLARYRLRQSRRQRAAARRGAGAAESERWAAFEDATLVTEDGFGFGFDLATNWKLPIENYLESYHLPTIHPGLNRFSRLEDHYNIAGPGGIAGQGSTVCRPPMDEQGRRLPTLEGLPDEWLERAEYIAVFPNVMFGIHRDHLYSVIATPVAPGRTTERARIYCYSPDGLSEELKALRRQTVEIWRGIFAEDVIPVEGMQAGRHSAGVRRRRADPGHGRADPPLSRLARPGADRPSTPFAGWSCVRLNFSVGRSRSLIRHFDRSPGFIRGGAEKSFTCVAWSKALFRKDFSTTRLVPLRSK